MNFGDGRVCSVLVGRMVAEKEAIVWLLEDIGLPFSCHLSSSLNSWTQ